MGVLGLSDVSTLAAASLIIALPPAIGIRAATMMNVFRREAFGHFRAATTALMVALGTSVLAYAILVVQFVVRLRNGTISLWPLNLETALLYVQIGSLAAAIALVLVVGTHLMRIVEPKRPRP